MRREKSLRIGVHHANAVVWEPVYRTRLHLAFPTHRVVLLGRQRLPRLRRRRRRERARVRGLRAVRELVRAGGGAAVEDERRRRAREDRRRLAETRRLRRVPSFKATSGWS